MNRTWLVNIKSVFFLSALLLSVNATAEQVYDTSRLNPCLKPLFEMLQNREPLVGKTHRCVLSFKFANDKWLIFHDASIGLEYDSVTRQRSGYNFLTFVGGVSIPGNIERGDDVDVTFRVESADPGSAVGAISYPVLGVKLLEIRRSPLLKPEL